MTAMAKPPKVDIHENMDTYSGSPCGGLVGMAKTVVQVTNAMTTAQTKITKPLAPDGVACREILVSDSGVRWSLASAKIPREAETAQPISTAIMSKITTSSPTRKQPTTT